MAFLEGKMETLMATMQQGFSALQASRVPVSSPSASDQEDDINLTLNFPGMDIPRRKQNERQSNILSRASRMSYVTSVPEFKPMLKALRTADVFKLQKQVLQHENQWPNTVVIQQNISDELIQVISAKKHKGINQDRFMELDQEDVWAHLYDLCKPTTQAKYIQQLEDIVKLILPDYGKEDIYLKGTKAKDYMAIVLETVNIARQANRLLEKTTMDNPDVHPPAKAYKGSGVSLNEAFTKLLPSKLLLLIQHCDSKQLLDKNKNDFDRFLESFETIANKIQDLMIPCATILEFLEINNASAAAGRKAFQTTSPVVQRVRALSQGYVESTSDEQRKMAHDQDYDDEAMHLLEFQEDSEDEQLESISAVHFDSKAFPTRPVSLLRPILKREEGTKMPCWMHLCDKEGCTRDGCQKDHSKEAMDKLYAEIGTRLKSNRA
jgi:hypothetical protein